MSGDFHAFVTRLELKVFSLQVIQQLCLAGQKHVRIVGNGTCGQAQGLDMLDLHKTVYGKGHIPPVHEGVTAGDHDLFDGG